MLDAAPDAMLVVRADGVVVYANAQTARLFGHPVNALIGQVIELLVPEAYRGAHARHRSGYAAEPRLREMGAGLELFGRRRDGTQFPVEISLSPLATSEATFVVAAVRDATERKQAQTALRRANEELEARVHARTAELAKIVQEKEVLLVEVHHRVKNNLQVISSLLSLQSRRVKEAATLEILHESQARIHAIALFHEKLYQSRDLTSINAADYLRDLVASVVRMYGAQPNVRFHVALGPALFDLDVAVSCGLIVNELVANACKHAFVGRPGGGTVRVSVAEEGERMRLEVSDDGVGLPPGFSISAQRTLGLHLVHRLVEQLGGAIELHVENGSRFRISFPKK